ncbi:NAD(P)H-binding protein [Nocardiopsis exhalans]|uniref:NAD(P)H-binding protein n=1 Tax=Nocardiopsis exhalans TaxID=163604 RepID=A0ABY5D7S7_9ACTN|nr:NAD(P)H-binding protein [Nocardiopsis exhalans]USY20399.1 NAD(P)H-binding protein [Nocardiopsis exhalans]
MSFLVSGATGTVGSEIVRQLVDAGHRVRALTRDPERATAQGSVPAGAEAVRGDLTDPESLVPHLEGAVGLHLITFGGDGYGPLETGPRLVELAEAAGVRRVTVLSDFYEGGVQEALRASSLAWTFLNPVEFMANVRDHAEEIRTEGVFRVSDDRPSALVHEADIAAVAVTALTEDGYGGQSYLISGPEALTPAEQAEQLSAATGQEVALVRLTLGETAQRLRAQGHDEEYVAFAMELAANPPEVGGQVQDTVERVTGRPARTFARWAAEHAEEFTR